MGMLCDLFAFPEPEARQLLGNPESIDNFIESQIKSTGLYSPEWDERERVAWASGVPPSNQVLALEKCWQGLHFTLTGTAWNGKDPLRFLLAGGHSIGWRELGHRLLFLPEYVGKLDKALTDFTDLEFEQRFDVSRMVEEDIYGPQGSRDDLLPMYLRAFQDLKWFVHQAAQRHYALLVNLW